MSSIDFPDQIAEALAGVWNGATDGWRERVTGFVSRLDLDTAEGLPFLKLPGVRMEKGCCQSCGERRPLGARLIRCDECTSAAGFVCSIAGALIAARAAGRMYVSSEEDER